MDLFASRYCRVVSATQAIALPLADLIIRLAVFRIFFWSGLVKIRDWDGTLQLFAYEYMVPLLPVGLAAALATACELGASSLVLVGFGTRFAALPLLAMTCVIQFVLGAQNPAYNQLEHYLWMAMLLSLVLRGGGAWSLDAICRRAYGFMSVSPQPDRGR
jgi:putative oxidoreductase